MKSLGGFIKERREAKNWSKRRLATEADISHTEVHRIENGERKNPSVPVLNALATALDVPNEELLKIAGYITEENGDIPIIERVFPTLKTEKQQQTVQKIVDGLARNSDLEEEDYDDLVDQMEMFLAYAKNKKNSR
ncbi:MULTISPECIES: helix-turn-helix domain-containing protein [Bacillaceae]|uniref:helix-turn-helix domain-containing protein n=1 Tax=Bacillaceae TaxID=186817 RepID=UPI00222FCF39|nr:helix-turn-helix domain-containing protein [Cytobacillus sp. NCCP-133]MDM5332852.1 helix-turn-helix domain-containing protein [Ureibacillus composti]